MCTTAAAIPPAGPPSGGTATRAVVEYSALEARLAEVAGRRDRAALEALLDDDFAAFGPQSRDPADRAAFIEAELGRPQAVAIYELAVLERGEFDFVSFLARRMREAKGAPNGRVAYLVDVWRRADHRLVARYRAEPRRAPPPPNAPNGRD